jgi:aldose 1-epimerase
MNIEKSLFGTLPNGEKVDLYTITTNNGMIAKVTNYGATLVSLFVSDKNGNQEDIVLGFDNLFSYLGDHPYFGCAVGRFCNRIGQGKFVINGKEFQLTKNEGENTLHGGVKGFHRILWDTYEINSKDGIGLKFKHTSLDGEEGFPGNLNIEITYLFTNNNEFRIKYQAHTDKTTHVNFTQHTYFNLNGGKKNVLNHYIQINADNYTEVDGSLIPTGKILKVEGTPLDLRKRVNLGKQIEKLGKTGFDHNYIINRDTQNIELAGIIYNPENGIKVETYTTEPAVQIYTGYYINNIKGKNNLIYDKFYGVCMETQHFPDSPNKPGFPSTLLNPGEEFFSETIYKFGIEI